MLKKLSSLLIFLAIINTPAKAEISPDTIIQIYQRLDNLEKKTRELNGQNEVLKHQIEQLRKTQKQGFLNIDERIDEIKNSTKAEDTSTTISSTTDDATVIVKPEEAKKEEATPAKPAEKQTDTKPEDNPALQSKKPVAEAKSETPEKKADDSAKKTTRAPTAYEKETYQAAFNKMSSSPTAATQAFREYIKLQPESPLAANAQYWIGEIMYSHNNYKGAVQEFIQVLQKYKYSNKAPDAAIKLGYSFYALKNWPYARRTFEDVIKYFPDNENAVNLAKKRLERMTAAGN